MRANQVLQSRIELPLAEAPPHALVLPFDFDWNSVDPAAHAAFGFLFEALRRHFFVPALQTNSTEEFGQLCETTLLRSVDIAQAISTLVHESTCERGPRAVIDAQLDKSDRRAANELAERAATAGRSAAAARLREVNVLISRARACVD